MTYEQKLAKYNSGMYRLRVCDVCHGHWSVEQWVRYIDMHGLWL